MIDLNVPPVPYVLDQSDSYARQTLADVARREWQHQEATEVFLCRQQDDAQVFYDNPDRRLIRFIPMLQQLYMRIRDEEGPLLESTHVRWINRPGIKLTALGREVLAACVYYRAQEHESRGWLKPYDHYRLPPVVALMLRAIARWWCSICAWGNATDEWIVGYEPDAIRDLHRLADFVRRMGRSQAFRYLQHDHERAAGKNFRSGCKYTIALLKGRQSVMILRIDLYYRPDPTGIAHGQSADKALDGYLRALRRGRIVPGYLGSMIKRQAGPGRGMHYHLALYHEPRLHRNAWFLAQLLGDYWLKRVGRDKGSFFNCYRWGDRFRYNSLGLVHVGDVAKLAGVRLMIWSMSKDDCKLKIDSKKTKDFWRSKLPAVPDGGSTFQGLGGGIGLVKRMLRGKRSQFPSGLEPAQPD